MLRAQQLSADLSSEIGGIKEGQPGGRGDNIGQQMVGRPLCILTCMGGIQNVIS